jgi:5-methylcytosine-specific restriction protein A
MNWIISANSNVYDHSSSFEHNNFIDWRQGNRKFRIGDIVYIYCTKPLQMIQYKCLVEKIDLDFSEIKDDKEYWLDQKKYLKSLEGKFIRLRLIEQVSNDKMRLDNLKKNGLNSAPEGPIKIKDENLLKYIEKYFTDKYQREFFPEIVNEDETDYEGAKRNITVNKYERSSKARENCIKIHGTNCKICSKKLSDIYGEIGKDFIHIHHLVPIHEIGINYKINFRTDLIPVCPNCHAMLHRKYNGFEPTIEELKRMIK